MKDIKKRLKELQQYLIKQNKKELNKYITLLSLLYEYKEFSIKPICKINGIYTDYDEKYYSKNQIIGYKIVDENNCVWSTLHKEDYYDEVNSCEACANILCEKLNNQIISNEDSEWFNKQ